MYKNLPNHQPVIINSSFLQGFSPHMLTHSCSHQIAGCSALGDPCPSWSRLISAVMTFIWSSAAAGHDSDKKEHRSVTPEKDRNMMKQHEE